MSIFATSHCTLHYFHSHWQYPCILGCRPQQVIACILASQPAVFPTNPAFYKSRKCSWMVLELLIANSFNLHPKWLWAFSCCPLNTIWCFEWMASGAGFFAHGSKREVFSSYSILHWALPSLVIIFQSFRQGRSTPLLPGDCWDGLMSEPSRFS